MLKKKSIYTKYLYLLSQFFSPDLPNLGAQIRCDQNRYTAVQTDLKYPLTCQGEVRGKKVTLSDQQGLQVPCTLQSSGEEKYVKILKQFTVLPSIYC